MPLSPLSLSLQIINFHELENRDRDDGDDDAAFMDRWSSPSDALLLLEPRIFNTREIYTTNGPHHVITGGVDSPHRPASRGEAPSASFSLGEASLSV